MDPRDRADAALARARARGAFVVTPEDAVSPMDASNTVQIPRSVVKAAETNHDESDSTMVISAEIARGQAPRQSQPDARQPFDDRPRGHQSGHYPPVPPQPVAAQQFLPDQPGYPQQGPAAPQQQPRVQQWAGAQNRPQEPEEPPAPREMSGLVPTVQQPGNQRSTLSRRLDGQ